MCFVMWPCRSAPNPPPPPPPALIQAFTVFAYLFLIKGLHVRHKDINFLRQFCAYVISKCRNTRTHALCLIKAHEQLLRRYTL